MFYQTQYVAAGVDSVAHRHKLVYVWETLLIFEYLTSVIFTISDPNCSQTDKGLGDTVAIFEDRISALGLLFPQTQKLP